MNKKERQAALFSLLSSKVQTTSVKVIESVDAKVSKTKDFARLFDAMKVDSGVFALAPSDVETFRVIRNLPNVKAIGVNYLNPHDILKYRDLVFTRESLEALTEHYRPSTQA